MDPLLRVNHAGGQKNLSFIHRYPPILFRLTQSSSPIGLASLIPTSSTVCAGAIPQEKTSEMQELAPEMTSKLILTEHITPNHKEITAERLVRPLMSVLSL